MTNRLLAKPGKSNTSVSINGKNILSKDVGGYMKNLPQKYKSSKHHYQTGGDDGLPAPDEDIDDGIRERYEEERHMPRGDAAAVAQEDADKYMDEYIYEGKPMLGGNYRHSHFSQWSESKQVCQSPGQCHMVNNSYQSDDTNGKRVELYTITDQDIELVLSMEKDISRNILIDKLKKTPGSIMGMNVNGEFIGFFHYKSLSHRRIQIKWFNTDKKIHGRNVSVLREVFYQ